MAHLDEVEQVPLRLDVEEAEETGGAAGLTGGHVRLPILVSGCPTPTGLQ